MLLLIFSALSSRWPLQRMDTGQYCGCCAQMAVWLYRQKVRWFCRQWGGDRGEQGKRLAAFRTGEAMLVAGPH